MRRWSPARSFSPSSAPPSSQTRSSSARPTISARSCSSRTSLRTTTSPEISAPRASTTLSDSLSATSWPRTMLVDVDLGVHGDAHLAAGGEDVDGAVVVGAEEGAVGRRRHRELLDLFAQRGDVLARFAEGGREALVLRDGLGELALGLEDLLLEGADPLRGVLEPAAQDDDLFLEALQLALELVDLALVLGETPVVLGSHAITSSASERAWRRTLHRVAPATGRLLSRRPVCVAATDFPVLGLRNRRRRATLDRAAPARRECADGHRSPQEGLDADDEGLDRSGPLHR